MDEVKRAENHIASFVEQDAFDDACSICLEAFSYNDPSTATICRHEFHLQCILEWCQRSSNCPMCWQPIRLKDRDSQELLVAVEEERCFRSRPSRNAAMYHHPTIGGFHLQHLPAGVNNPGLPDQIIQQLVASAAIWRSDDIVRGEGSRSRSSSHTSQQFMVSSADPNAISSSGGSPRLIASDNRSYSSESSSPSIDRAGPSDSFSDTWRSRLSSMSMKYKESISENTRVLKEKLFSRSSSSMADIVSDVRTEINSGIASVSRMMERLETRDNSRDAH